MSRLTRTIAAGAAAMTVLAASTAVAQTGDSTRTSPPTIRDGMMSGRGMHPRMGPDRAGGPRTFGPRASRHARGRFDQGALGRATGMRPGGSRGLLRGITLSTEQEKALRQQQARHLLATKPLMLELMSARTDQQLAQLNGDQKALDAATSRITATRSRLDSLRAQRSPTSDLRAVLTPDQQKILDQNLSEPPRDARPGRRTPGERGFRDGRPGSRPGGQMRPMRPMPPEGEAGLPDEGAVDR